MNTKRMVVLIALAGTAVAATLAGAQTSKKPIFRPKEQMQWEDAGGPAFVKITGDYKTGPYVAIVRHPGGSGGWTSPVHSHSDDYESIQITGTSSHWLKGEDGSKAPKMTPGSYWFMPGKVDHVSQCEKGAECTILIIQKSKFDFIPGK